MHESNPEERKQIILPTTLIEHQQQFPLCKSNPKMIAYDEKHGDMFQVAQIVVRQRPELASGGKGHPKTVRVATLGH
jgi:hypothetical protein